MAVDLSIAIINTNNCQMTLDCLESIYARTQQVELEVFVIDNASTDGSSEKIAGRFPQARLIRNEQRRGFSTNNNLALSQAAGRYLMLLNDDTVLINETLDILVQFMDQHPQAGVVGGALYNPDGSFQGGYDRFPNPVRDALQPLSGWIDPQIGPFDEPALVDWVCGACLLARREAVKQVGLLDTAFDPIYTEETDWCFRMYKKGWKIYFHPHARIIHFGSVTMNRIPVAKVESLRRHQKLFYHKHYGAAAVLAFKTLLFVFSVFKTFAWSLSWMIRNANARQEVKVHWHEVKIALFL